VLEKEAEMLGKICRLGILVLLALLLSLGVLLVALPYSGVGLVSEVGVDAIALPDYELLAIPEPIAEEATELAAELFGDSQEKVNDFVNQLLATYLEAKDKDFIVLFNSGGWGWNLLEETPGWRSISIGIESRLVSAGFTSLSLNYQRTDKSWLGCLNELGEIVAGYRSKARDLACRLEFLTDHIPDLKIIVAGESTGTIISDTVMAMLEDNPQVYSIQTGRPFWHNNIMLDRTLVMTHNGIRPDSFSQGDFHTIIFGNLRALFGSSEPIEDYGTILHYVGAPGHDYWWQYPNVYSEITDFLEGNFNLKW